LIVSEPTLLALFFFTSVISVCIVLVFLEF
jgi:hypothetical protein